MRRPEKSPPEITSEERFLVFEVAQGNPDIIRTIAHIRIICLDAKDTGFQGYIDILKWLNRNRIRGFELLHWIREKHENSLLRTIAFVRMKVHSDFGIKKIYAKPL